MLDVDVEVPRSSFVVRAAFCVGVAGRLALYGPSGSGKTTVLETIAGLVRPSRGHVVLGGRTLTSAPPCRVVALPDRRIGLLAQAPGLFAHLDVAANLAYGARSPAQRDRLPGLTEALGLTGLLGARPRELSGGQAQRVALGRVLVTDVDLVLLDEPFAGLDPAARAELAGLVDRVLAERRVAAILVSHELGEAQGFSGRLGVIHGGRLLAVGGSAELVRDPRTSEVAGLLGYRGVLPPAVTGDGTWRGVHPDRVVSGAWSERGIVLTGCVVRVQPHGPRVRVTLELPGAGAGRGGRELPEGAPVRVEAHLDAPVEVGQPVTVTALDPPLLDPPVLDPPVAPRQAGT